MHLKPYNKHLLILPREEERTTDNPVFIMPNDYQPPKSPYVIADVIGMSEDCSISLNLGDTIVVDRTTVQEIKADLETIYVVKENYVYGRLDNETNL